MRGTAGEDGKLCLGLKCIVFQNMLIAIYYRVICDHDQKFILSGAKLQSGQLVSRLGLTP